MLAVGLVARTDPFWIYLVTSAAVAYVLTASFNLIYGYAGIFSLAHVALYGIGAYVAVLLEMRAGLPFLLSTVIAMVVTAFFGVLLWWPTRHLKELFLAIATLGFAVTADELFLKWTSLTGGGTGLLGIQPAELFGHQVLSGDTSYYWLAGVGALLAWEVSRRLTASGMGRKFLALRDAPVALAATGVSPGRVRLVAFTVSGALAGLAGSLFAHQALFISNESFGLDRLILLILATLIGGAGTSLGPLLGVAVLVGVDEAGAAIQNYRELIFGVAIILLLGYGRNGVSGLITSALARVRRSAAVAPDSAAVDAGPLPPLVPRDGTDTSLLTVADVSVAFGGVTALQHVDLVLRPGHVLGLVGPNGAGKTTLVNVVTGHVTPTSGRVEFDGRRLDGSRPDETARHGVVRTFQTPRLVPSLSLVENVAVGFAAHATATVVEEVLDLPRARRDSAEHRRAARALLHRLGIAEYADKAVGSQPYGVQRLAEIARALATSPRFLLLDEPGAGLTEGEREVLTSIVRELTATGIGFLLIDHNVSFVAAVSDEIVVLDGGKVIGSGSPDEVLKRAEVVEAYLGGAA
jgi:ABC-type branched-subunit amino acid transport system ATPase component/ABC-type branched-subunit amino acid transport system permease subunit